MLQNALLYMGILAFTDALKQDIVSSTSLFYHLVLFSFFFSSILQYFIYFAWNLLFYDHLIYFGVKCFYGNGVFFHVENIYDPAFWCV